MCRLCTRHLRWHRPFRCWWVIRGQGPLNERSWNACFLFMPINLASWNIKVLTSLTVPTALPRGEALRADDSLSVRTNHNRHTTATQRQGKKGFDGTTATMRFYLRMSSGIWVNSQPMSLYFCFNSVFGERHWLKFRFLRTVYFDRMHSCVFERMSIVFSMIFFKAEAFVFQCGGGPSVEGDGHGLSVMLRTCYITLGLCSFLVSLCLNCTVVPVWREKPGPAHWTIIVNQCVIMFF